MKIALDYDRTYSADPAFWNAFVVLCLMNGHQVRIVTARDDRFDRTPPLLEAEERVSVIYTRGCAKRWFCEHFGEGFVPDVWIDDKPESIIANSPTPPDALAEWRATRNES